MMGMMGMMGRGPPPRANRQTVQITEEIKEEGFDDLLGFKVNRQLAQKGRGRARGTLFDANNFAFGSDDEKEQDDHFNFK